MDKLLSILDAQSDVRIIDAHRFTHIDVSAENADLAHLDTAAEFERYINRHLAYSGADAAFGGYNETRTLYQRSEMFNDDKPRNIHIGMDLWASAGTTVFAAVDGAVHSFDYNAGAGDYGPTIILEHHCEGETFYTLYGHLSVESIADLEIGDRFQKGTPLAALGDSSVNGDYAPHLHFQIIRDIADWFGDYPGVCNMDDLEFYLQNCPDPNVLLKIN